MFKAESGIYALVNKRNGHKYIGQSKNFKSRKQSHFTLLRANKHHARHLQNAYNKYGEGSFKFMVIERINNPTQEIMDEREQHWIEIYRADYNTITKVGTTLTATDIACREEDIPILRHWQTFERPAWHAWVYGGVDRPRKAR